MLRERFAGLWVALCAAVLVVTGGRLWADDAPTVREIYVPFDQFQQLKAKHPNGIVMPLAEYRELLRAALHAVPAPKPTLPTRESVVLDSVYRGALHGRHTGARRSEWSRRARQFGG